MEDVETDIKEKVGLSLSADLMLRLRHLAVDEGQRIGILVEQAIALLLEAYGRDHERRQ